MIKTDFARFNVTGSATDQFLTFFSLFLLKVDMLVEKDTGKGRLKTRDDETYILSDDEIYGNKKKQCGKYAKWLREHLPHCFVIQTRHVVQSLDIISLAICTKTSC